MTRQDPASNFRLTEIQFGFLEKVKNRTPQMQIYAFCYGATKTIGAVAEWLRSGLQSREHRFDSGPRLQLDYRLDQAFDRE